VAFEDDLVDYPVARAVRSFTLTGGRTRPTVAFPVEATIELLPTGQRHWPDTPLGRVARSCHHRSIAEISAYEALPIGVVRVLVGDLAAQGFVEVQQTMSTAASAHDRRSLIERTLSGLRNL